MRWNRQSVRYTRTMYASRWAVGGWPALLRIALRELLLVAFAAHQLQLVAKLGGLGGREIVDRCFEHLGPSMKV